MRRALLIIFTLIICATLSGCSKKQDSLTIGSKDFTEQYILGNMLALYIEANTNINASLMSDMASDVIFSALRNGVIDIYIDYTGTIYGYHFSQRETLSPEEIFDISSWTIAENYGLYMFDPLGFNNTYQLAVRRDTAELYGLRTISDLAEVSSGLIFGGSAEILNRTDGIPNLKRVYGLSFKSEVAVDGAARYIAITTDEIQVAEVFSTDGLLLSYDLVVLEDDLNFFPPYQGVIIVRGEVIEKHPEIRALFADLSGLISDNAMRDLNYRVDVLGETPYSVAERFLKLNNLIP